MPKFNGNESWLQSNNDTSIISINIKKHIKHGRHITKYKFADDPVSFKFITFLVIYKLLA